jgi:tetratricopeptide (TPR) repeat protein
MIQIKDDTFTANRQRAMDICRGIRERGLNFLWSCDTRVDVLSEDLLHEMRLAGCQRLSLGVESGSAEILKGINKKITVKKIIRAAEMAKSYGVQVRFYMMLGNRGETEKTFEETLQFLQDAKPHQYIFSCLSIYPGTQDFYDAEKQGWLDREIYFKEAFQELKTPFDATEQLTRRLNSWFLENKGLRDFYVEDVPAARAILERVGDHHAAHMDVAGACYRAGELDEADKHARRALELHYPAPGLAYNYLACIAVARGDVEAMKDHFMTAAKTDPQHHVLVNNVQATRRWFTENGPERGLPLQLSARHDFQLLERTVQPSLPGPLPPDHADWDSSSVPVPVPRSEGVPSADSVMLEGHEKIAFPQRRLRVLS